MTKAKKRNVIVALALVALLAIGGTLAYLTSVTGTKENTFTMGDNITGKTEEPGWDENNAKDFTPGKIIAKDPLIHNLSPATADPAYVAMTLTYQKRANENSAWEDATYDDLNNFINIKKGTAPNYSDGFNTTDWTLTSNNTIAYYNTTLKGQDSTSTIFDAVEIDPLALSPEQVADAKNNGNYQFDVEKYEVKDTNGNVTSYTYETYQMCDFQIIVKGYMVQSEGFANAQTAMQTAFPEVFGTTPPTTTPTETE